MFLSYGETRARRIINGIGLFALLVALVASIAPTPAMAEPPMLGADPAFGESSGQTYVLAPETWVTGVTDSYVTIQRFISHSGEIGVLSERSERVDEGDWQHRQRLTMLDVYGTPVSGFGDGGSLDLWTLSTDLVSVAAIGILDGGRIVLAGENESDAYIVAGLNASGAVDVGFATDGITTPIPYFWDSRSNVSQVLPLRDGGFLLSILEIVGDFGEPSWDRLARFDAGGSLVTSYGAAGIMDLDTLAGADYLNMAPWLFGDSPGVLMAGEHKLYQPGFPAYTVLGANGAIRTDIGESGLATEDLPGVWSDVVSLGDAVLVGFTDAAYPSFSTSPIMQILDENGVATSAVIDIETPTDGIVVDDPVHEDSAYADGTDDSFFFALRYSGKIVQAYSFGEPYLWREWESASLVALGADGKVITEQAVDLVDTFASDNHGGYIVTTNDDNGVSVERLVPQNRAPEAQDAGFAVAEDAPIGTVVGSVSASDPDGDTISYSIISGNASSAFSIGSDGKLAVAGALDYETTPLYSLEVTVSDGSLSDTAAVSVAITDVDENPPPDFSDDDGSVFEDSIEWLAQQGITKGCNPPVNDMFCPDDRVTRGQMAAFLVRALGLSDPGTVDFTDDDGSIFEDSIEKLAAAGITKGCNPPVNDMFCPEAYLTRGQMAAFLQRALDN